MANAEQGPGMAVVAFCPKCGTERSGRFCGGCGFDFASLDDPSADAPGGSNRPPVPDATLGDPHPADAGTPAQAPVGETRQQLEGLIVPGVASDRSAMPGPVATRPPVERAPAPPMTSPKRDVRPVAAAGFMIACVVVAGLAAGLALRPGAPALGAVESAGLKSTATAAPVPTGTAISTTAPTPTPAPAPTATVAAPAMAAGVWASGQYPLPEAVWASASSLLADGRFLVAGGSSDANSSSARSGAWVFDPATETWATAAPMTERRQYAVAVALGSGEILVAGGSSDRLPIASAERFLPTENRWVSAGSMSEPRTHATATLLDDGTVLVVGGGVTGEDGGYAATASADIYDPLTDRWTAVDPLSVPRAYHTATKLADGRVLVAGGADTYDPSTSSARIWSSSEIFDSAIGRWAPGPQLLTARVQHSAVLLGDGTVLVAGGFTLLKAGAPSIASAELLNSGSTFSVPAADMHQKRAQFRMLRLPDGKVIAIGGANKTMALRAVDIYDPNAGSWTPTGDLVVPVIWPAAGVLPGGSVVVAGGESGNSDVKVVDDTQLYGP